MKYLIIRSVVIFLFLFQGLNFSQEAGQILTRQEADKLFGNVDVFQIINQGTLTGIIQGDYSKIMFQLKEGALIILGDNRKVLFPEGTSVDPAEPFHLFSRSKVEELIIKGGSPDIFVEKRGSVLTLTCGDVTLEFSIPCPPYCD